MPLELSKAIYRGYQGEFEPMETCNKGTATRLGTAQAGKPRSLRNDSRHLMRLAWLMWLLTCISCPWAQAATPVTDDIAIDTAWPLVGSPYVISGDVRITGGAKLTIEPGVRVLFEAQASLRVSQGALSAQGTSAEPIVFTSIRDTAQATPMPGDWGVLGFQPDTQDDNTVLSHVQVRYGQGIVIEEASPVFRDVRIEHSDGPAMRIDLSSSPVGHGLEAAGNAINGILVPAGEIDRDVTWALRGIPYVLEHGVLHVGSQGFALSPSRLQLAAGVVGMLTLTIPEPAPAAGLGIDLVSSAPSVASVPASVVVAAGERSAQIEIQAHATGHSVISASTPDLGMVTSDLDVIEPPALSLTPSRTVISRERGGRIVVASSSLAPAGGREIRLESQPAGVLGVPASVVMPAGADAVAIEVAGLALGEATLTASAQDHVLASAQITVRPVSLNSPADVLLAPGAVYSMPILLTDPAPAGGLTISLENDNPSVVQVPETLAVPADANHINVDVQGVAIGAARIVAKAPGYAPGTSQVRVERVTLQLRPADAVNLPRDMEVSRSVRISHPAPAGGLWVSAQIADADIARLEPDRLFIPEGQLQATGSLTLKGMAEGSTRMQLQSPGLEPIQVGVTVGPPIRLEFSRSAMVLGKGLMTGGSEVLVLCKFGNANCTLERPLNIHLGSAHPENVRVPDTLVIPAGGHYASFPMTGLDLTQQPVAVNASVVGGSSTQTPLMVSVVTPELRFYGLDGRRGVGGAADNFHLMWRVPGAPSGVNQLAATDQSVRMSIVSASPDGLVPGFLDPHGNPTDRITIAKGHAGSYSSNGQRDHYVATPNAAGTYQVAASLEGVGEWVSDRQTVTVSTLRFSLASMVVGHGLQSKELYLRLEVEGQPVPTAEPVHVNLTSSDPDAAAVPTTVTIPAGSYYVQIPVTGMGLTTQPVTISASAQGYAPSQTPAKVTVVTPQLQILALDGRRAVGGTADDFYLRWWVPNSSMALDQVAAQDQAVEMSVVSAVPDGLVSGFQDWNGNPVTRIMIAEGYGNSYSSNGSKYHYVNSPVAAGTYRVAARLPGIGEWVSDIQTVTGAQLVFSRTQDVVGRGLGTELHSPAVILMVNGRPAATTVPITVNLSSANPDKVGVPDSVTIPAGQYWVGFQVSGLDLTDDPVAIMAATAEHGSAATPLMIRVVMPELQFLGLDGIRGVGGVADTFGVKWHVPGTESVQVALSDQIFTLAVEDADPAGLVPGFVDTRGNITEQIKISRGYSGNYEASVAVATPVMAGTYKISASLPGIGRWLSSAQAVRIPELHFSKRSAFVGKGLNSHEVQVVRWVGNQVFYGANEVSVSLGCASSAVCSVPASLTIPARQAIASMIIRGIDTGATQVQATAQGYVSAPPLEVTTVLPELVLFNMPETVSVGSSTNFNVNLWVSGAAHGYQRAAAPLRIDLTSSRPAVATVPSEIIIDAGNVSAQSRVTGVGAGTTTITASGDDLVPVTSGTIRVQQP